MATSKYTSSPGQVKIRPVLFRSWLLVDFATVLDGRYSATMKRESASLRSARTRAAAFKAPAHPIRLMVVDALSRRAHYVCELAKKPPGTQANLSEHLKVLLHAGIVRRSREGAKMMYALALPCAKRPMPCVAGALRCSTDAAGCRHGRPKRAV
jgi:DNA-binding transcriptional ArsR family regulator